MRAVSEFNIRRNEKLGMLVKSRIRDFDSVRVSVTRKWSVVGSQERQRHAIRKFIGA